ncbi:hypothetical protein [Okeania sp. SIO2C2]|nr:hypothetical protein [Okeania sp. SIO2C2]
MTNQKIDIEELLTNLYNSFDPYAGLYHWGRVYLTQCENSLT